MKPWILYCQILLALAVLLPLQAAAYSVAPSLVTLRSAGSGSSGFLRLENRATKPAAIQLTIHEHRKDLDGKTIRGAEADDDFIIFPAQLVMTPGDEVSVQVRWIGVPALATERAYTIVTEEVAIPRKAAGQADASAGVTIDITVLMNYEVRIYVTPPDAKAKMVVESVA